MITDQKVVRHGADARTAIRNAVIFAGDRVKSTLGPSGKNALLDRERDDRAPLITNDGVTVLKEISMSDECENQIVRSLQEAASRTDENAGDGTTTATTIAQKLVLTGLDYVEKNDIAVMDLSQRIREESDIVIEELKASATKIESKEQLIDVCTVSMEKSNKDVAKQIAEITWEVTDGGKRDGRVVLDNNFINPFTEVEVVPGYKERAKYAADFMQTNDKREMVVAKVNCVVTNIEFEFSKEIGHAILELQKMCKAENTDANSVVIFGKKFSNAVIRSVMDMYNKTEGKFRVYLVKIPSLTDAEIEDLAVYLDAKFINGDLKVGGKIADLAYRQSEQIGSGGGITAKFNPFGYADKVLVDFDGNLSIVGGRGTQVLSTDEQYPNTKVAKRVEQLKETIKSEEDVTFRARITNRIETLSGGVGIIKVGAQTDTERAYLKLKVEDAKNAAKAALEMGIVRGGGIALKDIAEKHKDFFIAPALSACYYQIQRNSRIQTEIMADMDQEHFPIPENVFDPVKVTISALQNAVSIASKLITIDTIVATKRDDLVKKLYSIVGD